MKTIRSSDITPESMYLSRRRFLKSAIVTAGTAVLTACAPGLVSQPQATEFAPTNPPETDQGLVDELGDKTTSFADITTYNNFYEFSTEKTEVARISQDLITSPWEVSVGGLVNKPKVFDLNDLMMKFTQEERIYRMRCVEGWSMVIPWLGFPLNKLLTEVEPTSDAKFVRLESLYDPAQMPGQNAKWFPWPYVEGLRLDEAMNDMTVLATGIYGKNLLPQNGAPIRLVVPWKYGFKSIKSIVKIDLVDKMPTSSWMETAPREYGFYSNVNPDVDHPRWSQNTERRIGEVKRRETLFLNGYEDQTGDLYTGMDLRANY